MTAAAAAAAVVVVTFVVVSVVEPVARFARAELPATTHVPGGGPGCGLSLWAA